MLNRDRLPLWNVRRPDDDARGLEVRSHPRRESVCAFGVAVDAKRLSLQAKQASVNRGHGSSGDEANGAPGSFAGIVEHGTR